MAKVRFKNGVTSVILRVTIYDSTSTTGGKKTGLTNASSGLVISTIADNEATATAYTVAASNVETITTLGTFSAPTSGKCRFKEVDSTNHPGLYEIQIADTRYAVSGARSIIVSVFGATGAAPVDAEVQLSADDPQVAKPSNFNLFSIDSNGRVDVIKLAGTTQTARDIGASVLLSPGTGTGQISLSSGAVTVGTNNDKTAYSLSQAFPTNFSSLSIDGSGRVDVGKFGGTSVTARDIGASVLLSPGTGTGQISLSSGAVTVGTNNDKTGYDLTQTFPTNFSALGITAAGRVDVGSIFGVANTSNSGTNFQTFFQNSGGVTTSIVDDVGSGGGGGTTDWTSTERSQLRYVLGIDGTATAPSATPILGTAANQTTILNRIGAFTGSGVNTVLGFFKAAMRSDASNPSDLGGTYDAVLHSLQGKYNVEWAAQVASGMTTVTLSDVSVAPVAEASQLGFFSTNGGTLHFGQFDAVEHTMEITANYLYKIKVEYFYATGSDAGIVIKQFSV